MTAELQEGDHLDGWASGFDQKAHHKTLQEHAS